MPQGGELIIALIAILEILNTMIILHMKKPYVLKS